MKINEKIRNFVLTCIFICDILIEDKGSACLISEYKELSKQLNIISIALKD